MCARQLERHWGLDGGMGVVALDFDILKAQVGRVLYGGIEPQAGQWAGLTGELLLHLVEMVEVDVCVAQSVDEFSDAQIAYLSDNEG